MSLTAVDAMAAERKEGGDGANRTLKKAKLTEFFFFFPGKKCRRGPYLGFANSISSPP